MPFRYDDTIDISEYDAYYLDQNASKKNEKVVYLTFVAAEMWAESRAV